MGLFRRIANNQLQGKDRDIIDNINNILNSKRDFSCYLKNYGVNDFSHYTSRNDIINAVMKEVEESILHHEPRVKVITMEQIPESEPFRMCFRMECTVHNSNHSLKMVFDSLWNNFSINDSTL